MSGVEDWKKAWQPVIDAVGRELWDERPVLGADAVEFGAIRRYVETLEFDCALHYDAAVARAHGYDDVIAPYTAMTTFTIPPMWKPGDAALFQEGARNAQPVRSGIKVRYPDYFPPYSAFFATDFEVDYLRPAKVGERLRRCGSKLVSCEPKQTKVGRGAFIKTQSQIETVAGEVLSRTRGGVYLYTPHPETKA